MNEVEVLYHVRRGPTKSKMFESLSDGVSVAFEMSAPYPSVRLILDGIQRESGSNLSWNLKGHVSGSHVLFPDGTKVKLSYHCDRESGIMTLVNSLVPA